jgi:hypothetical protein
MEEDLGSGRRRRFSLSLLTKKQMPVDSCDESDATNARGRVVGGSAREREKVVVGSSVRAQYKALAGGRKWYSGAPAKSFWPRRRTIMRWVLA